MYSGEKIIFLAAAFACSIASFSCKYKQQQVLFEKKSSSDNTPKSNFAPKPYRINPQDILQIRNLGNKKYIVNDPIAKEAEASGNNEGLNYQVEADSTVALPMLGRVKVVGLTRFEAAQRIETLYRKELKDPIIALKIINLKVTLLGEVKNQGIYTLEKDYTSLVEVIGAAGGLTDKASSKNIKIIRDNRQHPQVFELDLSNIETLSDSRTILQNNDIIYIAQHKKAIRSEKLQSMSAVLQPVITLLNTALIIYTLTR
uniref:polysaccharide biosynthesis/export family protein n=1 Tax=Pedobacter schmidteae TaxID=2201271 RepID=UPI000EB2D0D5|nr:polysaccharide biosynthesis/export family protein [Pedobacter schmidteae]